MAAGFGPLHETPPGALPGNPTGGDPPPAASGGGGTGTPPAPPAGGPPADDRSAWIPRERFEQERQKAETLAREKADRETADLAKKGEHEKLYEGEKAKREAAEARAMFIARRAAFIGKASGKVADPEAAYKLAAADGLLDFEVDDDGNAKDPKKVDEAIAEIVKRYEFLKPTGTSQNFGDPRGGTPPGAPMDPSKMTGRDMLRAGFEQTGSRRS